MKLTLHSVWLLAIALAGAPDCFGSTTYTVPPGLNPGDTYRLVFVTSDASTAASANIADYNAFVTAEADDNPALAALDATWVAIGSTDTVNAIDNIGSSVASVGIFRLDGLEVAAGTAGLFSGPLMNPLDLTQFNTTPTCCGVWTGTEPNGMEATGTGLGSLSGQVTFGSYLNNGSNWVDFTVFPETAGLGMYAISSELTVAAPEPATIGLSALGVGALLYAGCRKRRISGCTGEAARDLFHLKGQL
jgi:hypothetical protein